MRKVYIYLLNTMADWEIGHISAELNSRRFFKKDAEKIDLKYVSVSKETVKTMGDLTVTPDCLVDDISIDEKTVLIFPGADTWNDESNNKVLEQAVDVLDANGTVCAICGATVALAKKGLLDQCSHTSNGKGFLEMFVPEYKGTEFYVDSPAVADKNLITAGATGSLLWAKLIIERLNVFSDKALDSWYNYFKTGKAEYFFALMQQAGKQKTAEKLIFKKITVQTENLFELTYILLEKRQVTAGEMAEHFGVSQRTIYRWVDALNLAGVPVYSTKGKGGGIHVSEKYALDKTVFTDAEKAEILSSLNALNALSGQKNSAVSKFRSLVSSDKNTDWIEVDFSPWNPKMQEIRKLFSLLKRAVIDCKKVSFDYFPRDGFCTNRTVHPWKIVFRGQAWYLYGYCETKCVNLYFKLSRMMNLKILSEKVQSEYFTKIEDKEYKGYTEESSPLVTLKMKVSNEDLSRILDDFKADSIEEDTPQTKILTMTVHKMPWLVDYLLSFGSRLTLLEPEEIIKELKTEIHKMQKGFMQILNYAVKWSFFSFNRCMKYSILFS